MRWVAGLLFVVVFQLASSLYAQSSGGELALHEGMLASVFLKTCDKLTTAAVDFDGTGDRYQVEWWRCGSKKPDLDAGQFPIHYILIRPPRNKWQQLAVTLANSGNSDEYFIDQLHLIPAGSRQLLLISSKYYDPDHGAFQCVLERTDDQFQCSSSIEYRYSTQLELRVHEKSILTKVEDYLKGR
jgi:hypothetical protein